MKTYLFKELSRDDTAIHIFEVTNFPRRTPSQTYLPHKHDFIEIVYVTEGSALEIVNDAQYEVRRGDLLFINPMELHRPLPDPEEPVCERFVLWVNKEYLEGLSTSQLSLSACFDTDRPEHSHHIRPGASERAVLSARFGELVKECYSKDLGSEISAEGAFLQLMVQLNRLAGRTEDRSEAEELSQLVQKAMQYIGENLGQPLSLEDIAGSLFVSKYHLSHAFSAEVGVSVYRYLMLRRLLLARQLLSAGEPAGQVCRSCGFSDYTSFYRAFKSEYGISPRQFK
jgi:AraC-like DNA-binding protein